MANAVKEVKYLTENQTLRLMDDGSIYFTNKALGGFPIAPGDSPYKDYLKAIIESEAIDTREKYLVYHKPNNDYGLCGAERKAPSLSMCRWVATVLCSSLDEAFRLTNHIEGNWFDNKEVIDYVKNVRSTSVGDIIIDPDGQMHYVCDSGFMTPKEWRERDYK